MPLLLQALPIQRFIRQGKLEAPCEAMLERDRAVPNGNQSGLCVRRTRVPAHHRFESRRRPDDSMDGDDKVWRLIDDHMEPATRGLDIRGEKREQIRRHEPGAASFGSRPIDGLKVCTDPIVYRASACVSLAKAGCVLWLPRFDGSARDDDDAR